MSMNLIFRRKLNIIRAALTPKVQVHTKEFYDAIFPSFVKAVEKDTRPLPEGTTELILLYE